MRLRRLLLGAVTAAAPVFLAACYGPMVRFGTRGQVLDRASGVGVAGLEVECQVGADRVSRTTTRADGSFALPGQQDCDKVHVRDEKGVYAPAEAPGGPGVKVELDRAPAQP